MACQFRHTPARVPDEDRPYAMAVYALYGIGPARAAALRARAGSFRAAWHGEPELYDGLGLPRGLQDTIAGNRPASRPFEIVAALSEHGIHAVFAGDPGYPWGFAAMQDAPLVVYIRGELAEPERRACAVVGTRRVSPYGRWMTGKVAAGLARAGVTVVSGLALGADGAAHEAALAAGGRTIAVLAGGLDQIYPAEHAGLAARIESRGALISEYCPGTPTRAGNFVSRNRLIAGLSLATIVTEAGRRSGAMITAGFAADYGREVLAVPGRVGDPGSSGVHALIRDGAGLVESAQDVLAALPAGAAGPDRMPWPSVLQPAADAAGQEAASFGASAKPGGDGLAARLLGFLAGGPCSERDLINRTGHPPGEVRSELVQLELDGRVSRLPGGIFLAR